MNSFTEANREMLLAKAEEGFPVPVLDDAPVLPDRLLWAMKAFKDLRTCRPVGLAGPGAIPVTEMLSYFRLSGLPEYLWQEAKVYCVALDAKELAFYHSRQAAPKPPDIT